MADPSPSIEFTEEAVRIEFPSPRRLRLPISLLLLPFLVLAMYWVFVLIRPPQDRPSGQIFFCAYLAYWIFRLWCRSRRYSIILSPRGLIVRQGAWGLHWIKRHPLEQIHDLHVRYNPVLEKSARKWELIFDHKTAFHIIPYQMTLPEGQRIKEAIYSRFPQLAPQKTSWTQL